MGAFAKNFLPTLFSAFFTAEVDKPVLLATVEAFTPLAAPETLSTMLQSLLQKLAESGPPTAEAQQTQEDLLELLYVLGSAMPAPVQLVQAITPMIMQNSIGSLQKRAYKVLDAVLSSPLKENSDFVQSNLDYIVVSLLETPCPPLHFPGSHPCYLVGRTGPSHGFCHGCIAGQYAPPLEMHLRAG